MPFAPAQIVPLMAQMNQTGCDFYTTITAHKWKHFYLFTGLNPRRLSKKPQSIIGFVHFSDITIQDLEGQVGLFCIVVLTTALQKIKDLN